MNKVNNGTAYSFKKAIDLCKGDTIDVVIYELALILCDITQNVLDISTLDFECLLVDGQCEPDTLLETLQLIISHICLPPDPIPPRPFPMPIAGWGFAPALAAGKNLRN